MKFTEALIKIATLFFGNQLSPDSSGGKRFLEKFQRIFFNGIIMLLLGVTFCSSLLASVWFLGLEIEHPFLAPASLGIVSLLALVGFSIWQRKEPSENISKEPIQELVSIGSAMLVLISELSNEIRANRGQFGAEKNPNESGFVG